MSRSRQEALKLAALLQRQTRGEALTPDGADGHCTPSAVVSILPPEVVEDRQLTARMFTMSLPTGEKPSGVWPLEVNPMLKPKGFEVVRIGNFAKDAQSLGGKATMKIQQTGVVGGLAIVGVQQDRNEPPSLHTIGFTPPSLSDRLKTVTVYDESGVLSRMQGGSNRMPIEIPFAWAAESARSMGPECGDPKKGQIGDVYIVRHIPVRDRFRRG